MKQFVWSLMLLTIVFAGLANAQSSRRAVASSGVQLRGEFVGMERYLPNGNVVVVDTLYSEPGAEKIGVVRLYNGSKTNLISELKGTVSGDRIGSDGIEVLPDGNFLVRSPNWNGGQMAGVGAVTFCRAETGCDSFINAGNSKFGGQANQRSENKAGQTVSSSFANGPAVVDFFTNVTTNFNIAGAPGRSYMGQPYNLGSGASLTVASADAYLASAAAVSYTNVRLSVQFWGAADVSATPVFSSPLGTTYIFDLGSINTAANTFYEVNLTLPASGVTLPSATNQGIAFNYKGDTGSGLTDTDNLTSLVRGGTGAPAFAVGSVAGFAAPNYGYFRNSSGRTDFNFIPSDGRNIGLNSSLVFVLYSPAVAPAATISGRVTTQTGRGVNRALVVLTDSSGVTRYALGNSFGYYRFPGVATGATYTVSVISKRYTFAPQNVTPNGDLTNIDFVAQ